MQTETGNHRTYSISAGLTIRGIGPIHAHLAKTRRAKVAVNDDEALRAGLALTRNEGIIPALNLVR